MSATAWSITEQRGRDGLLRLEDDWRRLYRAIPHRSAFLSFECCLAYVEHLMPAPGQLRCLVLRRGGEARAICLLEPRTDRVLGLRLPVWGVLWQQISRQADALCVDDEARRVLLPAIVAYLRRHSEGRCLLEVGPVPKASPLWDGVRALGDHGVALEERETVYAIDTRRPFAELRAALPKKFRHNLNTSRHRLDKLGDARFVTVATDGDIQSELDTFLDVEASGWKGEAGSASAVRCCGQQSAYFRALATRLCGEADYCEISGLYGGGTCLATFFTVRSGRVCTGMKIGYDECRGHLAPGRLLFEHTVQRCCEDPDIDQFDVISNAAWLRDWRPDEVPLRIGYVVVSAPPLYAPVAALLQFRFGPLRRLAQVGRHLCAAVEAGAAEDALRVRCLARLRRLLALATRYAREH